MIDRLPRAEGNRFGVCGVTGRKQGFTTNNTNTPFAVYFVPGILATGPIMPKRQPSIAIASPVVEMKTG